MRAERDGRVERPAAWASALCSLLLVLGAEETGATGSALAALHPLGGPPPIECVEVPPGHRARPVSAPGDWSADFGILTLRMPGDLPKEDFDYVVALLEDVLPPLVEVLGPPGMQGELFVDTSGNGWFYSCHDQSIYAGPPSGGYPSWDNLFVYELAHLLQKDVLCSTSLDLPRWFEVGMVEAARYCVREIVESRTGRVMQDGWYWGMPLETKMSLYDMHERAGGQVWGSFLLHATVESTSRYLMAGMTLLLPVLSEVAAGRDSPHPLARLIGELRNITAADPSATFFDAIDRAWVTPVDGESPPSRWIRSRAIACPDVRLRNFLALTPVEINDPINPAFVRVMCEVPAVGSDPGPSILHYVNARGFEAAGPPTTGPIHRIPEPLPDGAYEVQGEIVLPSGAPLRGNTYMIVASSPLVETSFREGVAVIFTSPDGKPIEVADSEIEVSGRILARLPGALIVSTYSGASGSVTLAWRGALLGTVTVLEHAPRLVVMPVESACEPGARFAGTAAWVPYYPVRGQPLRVGFRLSESALEPTAERVEVLLLGLDGFPVARRAMLRSACDPDLFSAELDVPADLERFSLSFTDWVYEHGGPGSATYTGSTRDPTDVRVTRFQFDGRGLELTFAFDADPARVALQHAGDPTGTWVEAAGPPPAVAGDRLRWELSAISAGRTFLRLLRTEVAPPEIVWAYALEATPQSGPITALVPFPNPSLGSVAWPLRVTAASEIVLRVFDVRGRLIHEQHRTARPGVEVFSWDGSSPEGSLAQGVYLLHASGPAFAATRKVVIQR